MANPHKGEVDFQAGDKTYTLRYSNNALCQLEEAMGKTIIEISNELASWAKEPDKVSLSTVRKVFWAGLGGGKKMTLEAAGDIIDEAGGLSVVMEAISKALERTFEAGTKDARPPNGADRQNGIGLPS